MNFMRIFIFLFYFQNIAFSQEKPLELAKKLADRMIVQTSFKFDTLDMKQEQERTCILNFHLVNDFKIQKKYLAISTIKSAKNNIFNGFLGVSASAGMLEISLNSQENIIFSKKYTTKNPKIDRLDYDLIRFQDNILIQNIKNEDKVFIVFKPTSKNARIYISLLNNEKFTQTDTKFDIWSYQKWNKKIDFSALQAFPLPKVLVFKNPTTNLNDWRYYWGINQIAFFDLSKITNDRKYHQYANKNIAFFLDNKAKIEEERIKYGLLDSPFSLFFRAKLLDDLGMQTAALQVSDFDFSQKKDLINDLLHKIAQNIHKNADGTFARVTPDSLTIQSDDLMMGAYALLRIGLSKNEPKFMEEAAKQSLLFHQYLLDNSTGLYRHAYFTNKKEPSCCIWGRGMGWMMLTNAALLEQNSLNKKEILQNFQKSSKALLQFQEKNGGFHQILTDKSTYLETSATAMFVTAFAQGVANNWLEKTEYSAAIEKGYAYVLSKVKDNGDVEDIVRGTPVLPTIEAYNLQKKVISDPRGMGAIIWMCNAMNTLMAK